MNAGAENCTFWLRAVGTIVFELSREAWRVAGWRVPAAALLLVPMRFGSAVLLTVSLLRGLQLESCSCFGVFLPRLPPWYPPLEDIALVGLSVELFRLARGRSLR